MDRYGYSPGFFIVNKPVNTAVYRSPVTPLSS